jgi:hypothetical protein
MTAGSSTWGVFRQVPEDLVADPLPRADLAQVPAQHLPAEPPDVDGAEANLGGSGCSARRLDDLGSDARLRTTAGSSG